MNSDDMMNSSTKMVLPPILASILLVSAGGMSCKETFAVFFNFGFLMDNCFFLLVPRLSRFTF